LSTSTGRPTQFSGTPLNPICKELDVHKKFGAILAPFLFFVLVSASAAEGFRPYGTFSMGFSVPDATTGGVLAESGTNGSFGAAIGLETSDLFRWDIAEVRYVNFAGTDLGFGTSRSTVSLATTLNWGYFNKSARFQPYVSLGLGTERLRYYSNAKAQNASEWGFQWSLGGGIDLNVSENFRTGIRYRYSKSTRTIESTSYSLAAHAVTLEFSFRGGP
jgi:opacity protein-like surface antigen